jgi:thiosulfate/3-mercaptopyruvate sulfurtransferase
MNGGRKKWEAEGKEYTKSILRPKNSSYHATPPNEGIRAYFSDVRRALESTEPLWWMLDHQKNLPAK